MSLVGRGIRNASRNAIRTIAIIVILGLTIGLSFVMLIGHESVQNKIDATLASIGNRGNDTVIVPLATEQRLTHQDHDVASAVATADSLTDLSAVTGEITLALGPAADVTSDVVQAGQALGPLNGVKSLSLDSLVGAVGAAAIISFLIMVMIVRERKREVGILKAIGGPNRRIMCQFMTEALTFTLAHTQDTTVLLVTHDEAMTQRSDRTFRLADGRLGEE